MNFQSLSGMENSQEEIPEPDDSSDSIDEKHSMKPVTGRRPVTISQNPRINFRVSNDVHVSIKIYIFVNLQIVNCKCKLESILEGIIY